MPVRLADLSPETQARLKARGLPIGKGRSHYNVAAKDKRTVDGIVFGSMLEARVYEFLRVHPAHIKLVTHARVPLWSSAPLCGKLTSYISVDFLYIAFDRGEWKICRAIDAKPKRRRSRDWKRGKDAFEASYGVKLEEWSEVPRVTVTFAPLSRESK